MRSAIVPIWMLAAICALTMAAPTPASDLKPETVAAFDRYVRVTEARMQDDLHDEGFLVIDRLPPSRRTKAYDRVRNGEIYIQRLHTRENDDSIDIPSGLIHHWVAVIFVPDKTLSQAVAVLQDYDTHQNIYTPEVRRSQVLERTGGHARIYLQFYEKSIVTAVFNANFDVSYDDADTARFESTSRSTRIADVQNVGKKDERELPVGHDRGFLWRMNSYWRVEEKDGGVYLQNETIALTRRVPAIMAWIVNPLLESIPRSLLSKLLFGTRDRMATRQASSMLIDNTKFAPSQVCVRLGGPSVASPMPKTVPCGARTSTIPSPYPNFTTRGSAP